MRMPSPCRGLRAAAILAFAVVPPMTPSRADDRGTDVGVTGPRSAQWQAVQQALDEGRPKTAGEALAGIEAAATTDRAWAEVARAIATRVLADTGDRPGDDPERLVRLAAAIETAPAETRAVLAAIEANWTWSYFLENQWRFRGRTTGGADAADLARIAEWDLPTIIGHVRDRFAAAVGGPGSPERRAVQALPVAEWTPLLAAGSMPDAYRPTVWDVLVRDAIAFAASGDRGLVAPEDAFELDAAAPALGSAAEFLDWRPEADPAITDTDSPVLEAAVLFRDLLAFHREDADPTAFLAADLDRILWAVGAAVGDGDERPAGDPAAQDADDRDADDHDEADGGSVSARAETALRRFITRAGDHPLAALGGFHLAGRIRQAGDLVEAHAVAARAAAAHPDAPGGVLCGNLVQEIEARSLSLATERTWAAPFPVVRVGYRNLTRLHLRLARCDAEARLRAGRPHGGWIDDADRAAILALPAVRAHAADLPATPDYRMRRHDIPVATALDAATLEPGAYWVIASHDPGFGGEDNVVAATMVWVTRLAIVLDQPMPTYATAGAAVGPRAGRPRRDAPGRLAGHVVDLTTGAPVAAAAVTAFAREQVGDRQVFAEVATRETDSDGRFELDCPQGRELVLRAVATVEGREHRVTTGSTNVWTSDIPGQVRSIVLVTDRGIHRPGQTVFYKGIVCTGDQEAATYATVPEAAVEVILRDANGREVATTRQTTNARGSFHGSFPLPTTGLPGQWAIAARTVDGPAAGIDGVVGVRVEEYKRPKFVVNLAAPARSVPLGGEAVLTGRAETYTGLPVADATVRWRVERTVRFPIWCRWVFPWLPFDGGSQRIARGTATTDAQGGFTIAFPARPDRRVPRESLPVFSYRVVADVTDPGGETRSDERLVQAGYTDIEAVLSAEEWLVPAAGAAVAQVPLTVTTTTLDGEPCAATGTLTVHRLVQPADVPRGELLDDGFLDGGPWPAPRRRGGRGKPGRPAPPPTPDPANPETWDLGEAVFTAATVTPPATGKAVVTAELSAGIYRATCEIPARGDVPAVKATRLVEVLDPVADRYGVRRPFLLRTASPTAAPGETFQALVGTGYDAGRALVEISQAGRVLERFWTAPDRTQWPLTFAVTAANRGGFTVRAWLVRDGRLHTESRVIDVPWTDRSLDISWERFTRRTQPGRPEVWRARIRPAAGGDHSDIEMLGLLYDASLDALASHAFPDGGLTGLFRRESGIGRLTFTNEGEPLHLLRGGFTESARPVPEMTYRTLRSPFGSPQGMWGVVFGRGGGMLPAAVRRGGPAEEFLMAAPMAMAAGGPADSADTGRPAAKTAANADVAAPAPAGSSTGAPPPPPRKNLVETAFFLPTLVADADGVVTIEFTLPDTLTTWRFQALAHDAALRSGTLDDRSIAAKDLMVEPLMPRFLREGDVVRIPVKVSNASTGRLTGTVRLALVDARTDTSRDGLLEGPREMPFDLAAGESRPVVFTVKVADGTETLRYLATGTAGREADGEEDFLPVLPRRVPVTETIPITVRGPGSRRVTLERLAASAGTAIENQSLVVQATSNPAWYAVLALPAIMEQADESTETLFTRLYANTLARHLATRDPRIERIFAQWRAAGGPLESPLERNTDLVRTLLAETPWVREAVDEREARARIALLFDANRAADEARTALARLETLRNDDGGWPWFPGGRTSDPVSLGIVAGFGRLRAVGAEVDIQPALRAVPWLDARLIEERILAERRWPGRQAEMVLTPTGVYALYARSFFTADQPAAGAAAEAIQWALDVGRTSWMKLDARMSQGHLAIALKRSGDRDTAGLIIDSLRQRAVDAAVKPGTEPESWQGMWWRDPHPAWWSWTLAPIATQAIMIEAFDEVAGDAEAVEALQAWLLTRKRTSRWPGSRATADAVGALLGRGADLLDSREPVRVTVGDTTLPAERAEAGSGFFETRFVRGEITPALASVTFEKPAAGLAFGGVHWLHLDDVAHVPAAGREELALEKRLFVKRFTKAGPELVPAGGTTPVAIGDELVVRLVVTSDRDYEFLELCDHRPSLTEPVDVLSDWRWADGVGWYGVTRDASTQFFFERLPRGTHVFEYSLRAAHQGSASSGFATIQSRYAPEFSARSASVPLEVGEAAPDAR